LNWISLTARRYKIGLIKCLANRIWRICTDEKERKKEIKELRHRLLLNDFPPKVIEHEIDKFRLKKQTLGCQPPPKPENKRFIVLPYTSKKCEDFGSRLRKLIVNNFKDLDFNVAFQTPRTVGHLFPFKDRVQLTDEKSLVIYKIKCTECEATYIGKTIRILNHRVNEHKLGSSSACRQHQQTNPTHTMDYDNIEVIDQAENDMKLRIK